MKHHAHILGQFTVALSHDVDRVHKSFQSFTHFVRYAKSGQLRSALYQARSITCSERYWCFEKICEIEAARNVKSTFFFLNETYPFRPLSLRSWRLALGYYSIFWPKVTQVIRQLDSEGFEIGLHGSYRSYCDRNLLAREKTNLEGILGRPVHGIRQHYLNLTRETWHIQRSLGFLYDASFGHRDRVGFKDGMLQPFPLDERNDFYVVPQAIMDCCLMGQPDAWESALQLIDFAEKRKAFLVLNWHQQIFDEREYPGYSRMYVRILDECLKRKARFTILGEYIHDQLGRTADHDAKHTQPTGTIL